MADQGSIGTGHSYFGRSLLPTSDFPAVKSTGHAYFSRIVPIVVRSVGVGKEYTLSGRALLPTSDFPLVNGKRHSSELASKNIHVWSTRPNPNMGATADAPFQVYLQDTPGILSGQLHTAVSIDANHIVRLYYRPTGYMIDQVRTDVNGMFTFTKNIDKAEQGNYYIIAFDLNSTYNAVVYDLLTPG